MGFNCNCWNDRKWACHLHKVALRGAVSGKRLHDKSGFYGFDVYTICGPRYIAANGNAKLDFWKPHLQAHKLSIASLTVDRYHAIVNPVNSMKWRSIKKATGISIAVWTVSVLICCPYLIFTNVYLSEYENNTIMLCNTQWPSAGFDKAFTLTVILTTFVLPFTIMTVCYYFIVRALWRRSRKHNASSEKGNIVNSIDEGEHRKECFIK
ncbi:NPSR1 [Mytilus coruscus]|uniref:NPSR1 n=1 Tax=Mytilus coruscus TaxID=42192 RepID=A0A6J8EQZ2_MYTCO|nr:NPSR1 [Mytilus coruscus]